MLSIGVLKLSGHKQTPILSELKTLSTPFVIFLEKRQKESDTSDRRAFGQIVVEDYSFIISPFFLQ